MRTIFFGAMLLLLPSISRADDRYFWVQYRDGGNAPLFMGEFETRAECNAERASGVENRKRQSDARKAELESLQESRRAEVVRLDALTAQIDALPPPPQRRADPHLQQRADLNTQRGRVNERIMGIDLRIRNAETALSVENAMYVLAHMSSICERR